MEIEQVGMQISSCASSTLVDLWNGSIGGAYDHAVNIVSSGALWRLDGRIFTATDCELTR